jgi:hypothetical protein
MPDDLVSERDLVNHVDAALRLTLQEHAHPKTAESGCVTPRQQWAAESSAMPRSGLPAPPLLPPHQLPSLPVSTGVV